MEKVFLGVLAGSTDAQVLRAVQGVIDFIYYAHFEVHTDESLRRLDDVWLQFHQNKKIFKDLKICQHFNISKLHNIKHYLDSIRSLGTADGYNTESSERLHIDLAKMGYNASNKKDYVKQMTVWLRRQEAVHRFGQYLEWAVPGYVVGGEEKEEEDEGKVDDEDEGEAEEIGDNNQQVLTSIAKKPAIVGVNVNSLSEDYGAADFNYYVDEFLPQYHPAYTAALSHALDENPRFLLYKRLVLTLPPVPAISSQPLRDVVHAVKGVDQVVTTKGVKKAVAERFSTVLVRVGEGNRRSERPSPLQGASY